MRRAAQHGGQVTQPVEPPVGRTDVQPLLAFGRKAQELGGDAPERVHVRTSIRVEFARELLGAHVARRSAQYARPTGVFHVDGFGDAEVDQLRLPGRIDEDVRGLQIAVNDAALVGVVKSRGDVDEQLHATTLGRALGTHVLVQRHAADVLHRQVGLHAAAGTHGA